MELTEHEYDIAVEGSNGALAAAGAWLMDKVTLNYFEDWTGPEVAYYIARVLRAAARGEGTL